MRAKGAADHDRGERRRAELRHADPRDRPVAALAVRWPTAMASKDRARREWRGTMFKQMLLAGVALVIATGTASAKDLKAIGFSVGTLGNIFFLTMVTGVEAEAKEINPDAKLTVADSNYDLVKQSNQPDSFVAAGVD